jgi:hypothetical protein
MSTSLRQFAKWFLSQPFRSLRPPQGAMYRFDTEGGTVQSIVLYRQAPFQVELFCGIPGDIESVPEHSHPNVDSIEYVLGGNIDFSVCGKNIEDEDRVNGTSEDGSSLLCGLRMHVRPGAAHAAIVGPAGGLFLSIQKWREGLNPTSVGFDWEGPAHLNVSGS